MNRHDRRAAKATGDVMMERNPALAKQRRVDLVRGHVNALEKAWKERDPTQFHDPVLLVADTEDPIGREFTPPGEQPGGVVVGIVSASELGTKLNDVEPDVYSRVRGADTSRPFVVCIAHWGTTAGYREAFGIVAVSA